MRNRQNQKQKLSYDQIDAVFSSMVEGMVIQDPTGKVLFFNQAALDCLAVTADQLLGKEPCDPSWNPVFEDGTVVSPDQHPATVAQRTGIAQRNVVIGASRPDGELRWFSASAVPLFKSEDHRTEPYQVVITFRDVTEEHRSREIIEQKEREVSTVLDTMPVMVAYWDSQLQNVLANRRYGEVFGIDPKSIKGKNLVDVIGQDLYDASEVFLTAALRGERNTFELELPRADGAIQPSLVSYVPDVRNGTVHGFFTLVTDVTELKRLEAERRDLESKFLIASKMSALGEMAAGIAHEINNPLAIINCKTSILQTRLEKGIIDPLKINSDLETIGSTVERIARTVRGLLAFSRNTDAESTAATNVQKLIEDTLDLCREKLKNRGVDLRLEVEPTSYIDCRPNQISQILINLINNACDAIEGQEQPWLKISVESHPGALAIRVTDSGKPLSQEIAAKIMNPFFTTKEVGKGTGLGLSISKGLAESHGGTLTFDEQSKNTAFVLELPKVQKPAESRKAA
jgi:PAS domain S-box-containing protein